MQNGHNTTVSSMSAKDYLDSLDNKWYHLALLRFIQYPKTDKLDRNDKPVAVATYTCPKNPLEKCDFSQVFQKISHDPDLLAYGSQGFLKRLVTDIEDHPEDFIPHKFDGFQFYRCGVDLLHMERLDDSTGKPCTGSRTGFIEYNDLRSEAMVMFERERMRALRRGASDVSRWWNLFSR